MQRLVAFLIRVDGWMDGWLATWDGWLVGWPVTALSTPKCQHAKEDRQTNRAAETKQQQQQVSHLNHATEGEREREGRGGGGKKLQAASSQNQTTDRSRCFPSVCVRWWWIGRA